MSEPAVALTDYLLAIECALFALAVLRRPAEGGALRAWVILFFASATLGPLAGGTLHGFLADRSCALHVPLWRGTLLAIGLTALAAWGIGARMMLRPRAAGRIAASACAMYAAYAVIVVFVHDAFWVAIAMYLPASLWLLAGFAVAARRDRVPRASFGILGIIFTFAAAGLQHFRVGIHTVYLDHNALYHLVQAVALALIFVGLRNLLRLSGGSHADAT